MTLKVGVVGHGNRGAGLLRMVAKMKDVEVLAVCDKYQDRAESAARSVKNITKKEPLCFTDYREIFNVEGIRALLIFSSWETHIPMAIEAMEHGLDVATEVGGAYNLEECFKLVEVAERTGRQCMMLENCCYGRYELMVKKLVEEGKFGTVVHCDGGYRHDLREEITFGKENRHYRLENYLHRNCENYPTHELGPIAKILRINNGNRFLTLTSTASKGCGLHEFVTLKKADDKELREATFQQGDIVTTVIRCENGETITLTLDTSLPRFYSRQFTVHGTKGLYQEDGDILYLEGLKGKHWLPQSAFFGSGRRNLRRYEHPIWKAYRRQKTGGHGGIDYLVMRAFVESIIEGRKVPIDVYDTALWMSITPLSEKSIAEGSMPQEVPDFTHGLYKTVRERNGGKYDI